MTIMEFVEQHPFLTIILIVLVGEYLESICKAVFKKEQE